MTGYQETSHCSLQMVLNRIEPKMKHTCTCVAGCPEFQCTSWCFATGNCEVHWEKRSPVMQLDKCHWAGEDTIEDNIQTWFLEQIKPHTNWDLLAADPSTWKHCQGKYSCKWTVRMIVTVCAWACMEGRVDVILHHKLFCKKFIEPLYTSSCWSTYCKRDQCWLLAGRRAPGLEPVKPIITYTLLRKSTFNCRKQKWIWLSMQAISHKW